MYICVKHNKTPFTNAHWKNMHTKWVHVQLIVQNNVAKWRDEIKNCFFNAHVLQSHNSSIHLALSYGNIHCLKENIGNNKALKGQGHDFFDNIFSD